MAKIDWDYAANADRWTLEEFSEFVCPNDPSARAKLDRLARVAINARTLSSERFRHARFHPGIYGETPQRKNDIIKLIPAEALSFAQRNGFTPPPELAGIESPRPANEKQLSTTIAADNEPVARRNKAPDAFIAALIRLVVEISKRAAEKRMPFDVDAMPGRKADFQALAIKFDDELDQKTPRTFDDYLAGLLRFKQGAQQTTFYQDLFPEHFAPRRSDP